MPKPIRDVPDTLRPFTFHGLDLSDPDGRDQCFGDCPACGSSKFAVHAESGMASCYSSGCPFFVDGGEHAGGSVKFIRWLWQESDRRTTNYDGLARDRGLLYPETLVFWGACQSAISGNWLMPAYNADGALVQLYKRIWVPGDGRWEMRPTPEVGGHALHGVQLLDRSHDTIFLAEGPFDAMALWETMRIAKIGERGLEFTGNPEASLLANASVLAVANCGAVGEPLRRVLELFRDKRVVLCFDADRPKDRDGVKTDGAGWGATKRAAAILHGVAREVQWLKWGEEGWRDSLPDGWDVRDAITKGVPTGVPA